MEPIKPMKPMEGMAPMATMDFGPAWWPSDLGAPSSSGAQDGVRYAFFPSSRRLLIEDGGKLTTYDTGDHQITGVSQARNSGRSLAFTSQNGELGPETLRKLD